MKLSSDGSPKNEAGCLMLINWCLISVFLAKEINNIFIVIPISILILIIGFLLVEYASRDRS